MNTALPRWRSHKIVSADQITEVGKTYFKLACGEIIPDIGLITLRGTPEAGDYYVVYADGYASWSPAAAFEDGYTLIANPPAWVEGDPEGGRPEEC